MPARTLQGWLENYYERIKILEDRYNSPEQKISVMSPDKSYYKKLAVGITNRDGVLIYESIKEAIKDFKSKIAMLTEEINKIKINNPIQPTTKYSGEEIREFFKNKKSPENNSKKSFFERLKPSKN